VAAKSWTPEEDQRLRKFYDAFSGDVIPVDAVAKALDRTPGAVRYRASKLGLTERNRPRAARGRKSEVKERICVECNTRFAPRRPSDPQKTCGRSCAAKQRSRVGRGRATGRAKVGRRADLGDVFFRSSWEANYARYLNWLIACGDVVSWEFEPEQFRFPVKRGIKVYTPDFKVHLPDGRYEWHEVKGWMDDASRIKLKRFALHHAHESVRLKLIDRDVYQQIKRDFADRLPEWE
jgi:hypothetical protein